VRFAANQLTAALFHSRTDWRLTNWLPILKNSEKLRWTAERRFLFYNIWPRTIWLPIFLHPPIFIKKNRRWPNGICSNESQSFHKTKSLFKNRPRSNVHSSFYKDNWQSNGQAYLESLTHMMQNGTLINTLTSTTQTYFIVSIKKIYDQIVSGRTHLSSDFNDVFKWSVVKRILQISWRKIDGQLVDNQWLSRVKWSAVCGQSQNIRKYYN
jgi:hypothetical protein